MRLYQQTDSVAVEYRLQNTKCSCGGSSFGSPYSVPGFDNQKLKNFTAEKKNFFDQQLQSLSLHKGRPATGEAFRPYQNWYLHFFHLCSNFLPSWIQIHIPKADPDPAGQNQSEFTDGGRWS